MREADQHSGSGVLRGVNCIPNRDSVAMQLGGLVPRLARYAALQDRGCVRRAQLHAPWIALVVSVIAAVLVPAQAAELDEMVLPWSALPHSEPGPHPLIPGSPIAIGFDPSLVQWSETPAPAISTTLRSSAYGDVLFGVSVDEYQEGDSLFGDARKDVGKRYYKAILAFDQPLGFSTALSMDVLSKDQRRGLTKFQLFQIGVTHPFADRGRITVGSALFLNGNNPMNTMNPEWSPGIRLYLPFN
jgi:hypothetical protein